MTELKVKVTNEELEALKFHASELGVNIDDLLEVSVKFLTSLSTEEIKLFYESDADDLEFCCDEDEDCCGGTGENCKCMSEDDKNSNKCC